MLVTRHDNMGRLQDQNWRISKILAERFHGYSVLWLTNSEVILRADSRPCNWLSLRCKYVSTMQMDMQMDKECDKIQDMLSLRLDQGLKRRRAHAGDIFG